MDKQKALEAALAQIDKNFGKGSIMRLGANDRIMEVEAISTGSLGLDIALGIGGLPRGRVVEIYGPESSGKTTLSLSVVAEAQKKGGICAFVDAEHALDPVYARKLGVKVEDLLISQPDDGEQALEIADTLVRSGAVDVLVVEFGGGPDAQGRARGRDGRHAARHAGAPDEQGAAQAHRLDLQVQVHGDLHQPDPHEDRHHVRQPRDDDRRQCAEVLRLACASTSAASARSRSARRWSATRRASRSSRTRWRRPSSRSSSTSCTARASPRPASWSTSASRPASSRSRAPGSPSAASASARAARTPRRSSRSIPRSPTEIEKAIRQNAGLIVDKMLQAAPEGDEAADAEEGPDGFVAEDEPEADSAARGAKAKRCSGGVRPSGSDMPALAWNRGRKGVGPARSDTLVRLWTAARPRR